MNARQSSRTVGAFTLIEMLCVIGIIAILAALLLPALSEGRARARRIQCVGQLKELGVAFQAFAHDHQDRFPMQVPKADGGSLEFAQNGLQVSGEFYFSYRHFQPLANEIVTPRLLFCPAETTRTAAPNFAVFENQNLSYFVGITADPRKPEVILAGDRNITNEWTGPSTLLRYGGGAAVRWTEELHRFKGNVLFTDGHVDEVTGAQLASSGRAVAVQDLALPSVPPGNVPPALVRGEMPSATPPAGTATALASRGESAVSKAEPDDVTAQMFLLALSGVVPISADSIKPTNSTVLASVVSPQPRSNREPVAPLRAEPASSEKHSNSPLYWLLFLLLAAAAARSVRRLWNRLVARYEDSKALSPD